MARVVILTGFMGAGKSAVARRLARRLGWEAVDLDDWIEARHGRKISEIFETDGEETFREMETRALAELLGRDGVVIATGGGTLLREANRTLLMGHRVVNLAADFETLHRRIRHTGHVRPLVNLGEARLRELYEARRPRYESVACQVTTAGKTPDEVALEILELCKREGAAQ